MQGVLVTAKEVADYLSVSSATVLTLAKKGIIPAHKITSRIVRFNLSEVIDALERAVNEETHNERDVNNA